MRFWGCPTSPHFLDVLYCRPQRWLCGCREIVSVSYFILVVYGAPTPSNQMPYTYSSSPRRGKYFFSAFQAGSVRPNTAACLRSHIAIPWATWRINLPNTRFFFFLPDIRIPWFSGTLKLASRLVLPASHLPFSVLVQAALAFVEVINMFSSVCLQLTHF